MLPSLDSLRCFIAAAELLNFRAAAKTVALSPGALSQRILQLEDQLGAALFERTTRRVTLTGPGEALLPQARRTLEAAERCAAVLKEKVSYELTVGTRFELGLSWLLPALKPLAATHPERTLHLYFGDSAELLAAVRRAHADCAVTSARLTEGGLHYEALHEERYVFVTGRSDKRARALAGPEDASNHVLLDLHRDLPLFRYFQDSRPPGEVWQFQRVEYLGTIAAVRHRLLEGAGVAVLPEYFVRAELRARRLKQLLPEVRLHPDFFRLVWRAGHPRENELRALAAELRQRPLR